MSLAVTLSRATQGIAAPLVTVETHLSNGLPSFTIVGLPETAVKESRDRVRSAIINSHFEFPDRRITINLAPADLPKEGSRFDLAIAIGILAASGQVPKDKLGGYEFIGELALSGNLRYVNGMLSALINQEQLGTQSEHSRALIIPAKNNDEASLPIAATTYLFEHILEVCAHINGSVEKPATEKIQPFQSTSSGLDIADVRGQPQAKRAIQIAAAGGHNLLFIGPPGTGKTMLASRLPSVMPPLNQRTAIEVAAVQSEAGKKVSSHNWRQRPFRNPHHTASAVALVGGGSNPKPGEVSLAHGGILFLDEFPEFDRKVLEVLREPLESGQITISRAARQVEFPARFQLIAAMNPCPCGFYGDTQQQCRCSAAQVLRYRSKISGPLLDRIDLHVGVARIPIDQLVAKNQSSRDNSTSTNNVTNGKTDQLTTQETNKQTPRKETSAAIKTLVLRAHQIQQRRQQKLNAHLDSTELTKASIIDPHALDWLSKAMEKVGISARAFHRLLKVARTIADLELANTISAGKDELISTPATIKHVKEALAFRPVKADHQKL